MPINFVFDYLQRRDFHFALYRPIIESRKATQWYPNWVYAMMENDEIRNHRYRKAIRRHVGGKVVLEIGTGRKLLWAKECIQAGAKHVYAIEANPRAYELSSREIQRLGLKNVTLFKGFSDEIQLPERCEVLVHDLVGSIGSAEGMVSFIQDAKQRHLVPGALHIPVRCRTFLFPTMPPALSFLERIFSYCARGGRFSRSIKMMYHFGFREDSILSSPILCEDIQFSENSLLTGSQRYVFEAIRSGPWDGVGFFIKLDIGDGSTLDSFKLRTNWYIPVVRPFSRAIPIRKGDKLEVDLSFQLERGSPHYTLRCYRNEGGYSEFLGEYSWQGV